MTETPFGDLDDYIALPRVSGLAVSPDGSRVVTTVSELNEKRTEYVAAVWEVDPEGHRPARRLTRGAKGESSPAFTSDGDVLFVAVRPTEDDDKPPAALWRLPAVGGEAVEVLAPPGGVELVRRTATPREPWCVHRFCRRRTASTMTAGYGICARTTRSLRFCTPAIRFGTGTRTSVPVHRICSGWTWRTGRRAGRSHAAAGRRAARRRLRRQPGRPLPGDGVAAARARRLPALGTGADRPESPATTRSLPTRRTPTCGARPSRRTDRRWHSSASRTPRRHMHRE